MALSRHLTVAVAESLTSGSIAQALGAAPDAAQWFRGGVVAYQNETTFRVLGVDPGPVVTATCADQMAAGARAVTGSDLSVAVTGVGGPGPAEGHSAGTVYIAVNSDSITRVFTHHFDGSPTEIIDFTVVHALGNLKGLLLDV